jgi:hypothetical protein
MTWHAARKRSEHVARYGKGVMFVPLARFPRFAILLFRLSFFFLLSLVPLAVRFHVLTFKEDVLCP